MSNFAFSALVVFMFIVLPIVLWIGTMVLVIKEAYDEEKERLFKR